MMHVGIANLRWCGKHSRHSWRMHSPQFYVSGERLMDKCHTSIAFCLSMNAVGPRGSLNTPPPPLPPPHPTHPHLPTTNAAAGIKRASQTNMTHTWRYINLIKVAPSHTGWCCFQMIFSIVANIDPSCTGNLSNVSFHCMNFPWQNIIMAPVFDIWSIKGIPFNGCAEPALGSFTASTWPSQDGKRLLIWRLQRALILPWVSKTMCRSLYESSICKLHLIK